jgi:hypothetical protein
MKTFTTLTFVFLINLSFTQINYRILDQNNTSVFLSNEGTVFTDFITPSAGYEVPNGSGLNTIYSTQFWFAGKESNGTIHSSLGGYPGFGTDIFKGPFSNTNSYNDPAYQSEWGISMWDICQSEIDIFKAWWECSNGVTTIGCENVITPTVEILDKIYNWPAHGNVNQGESYYMLPYWDTNSDGVYNPADGDYPIIKGCCAVYMIQNDAAIAHTISNGPTIGIELHYMFYQYSNWDYINDVTFVDVLTINKGTTNYTEFSTGIVMDADIGNYSDDYTGCDSTNNLMLFYNADNNDETGYSLNPPVIGVVSLENNMTSCAPYIQNPSGSNEIWNLMNGKKTDGTDWLNPAGIPTNYVYSGSPNNPLEWSEFSAINTPGDRRSMMANKHISFNVGDSIFESYAILYARNGTHLQNAQAIIDYANSVKLFYDTLSNLPCINGTFGLEEIVENNSISIYPNPTSGIFKIVQQSNLGFTTEIYDYSGNLVMKKSILNSSEMNVDLSKYGRGLYIVKITNEIESFVERVVLE